MIDEKALPDEGFGVWMTLTELADAKGVGKAALSERITRLEREGLITTRAGKGRSKLINVVEFDLAVGAVTDLSREQGQATRRIDADGDEPSTARMIYTRETARRAGYDAELARLNLEERLGSLVKVADLQPVIEAAIAATGTAIDSLAHDADALRELAQDDDAVKFDHALRDIARRIRLEAVAALKQALKGRTTA